MPDAAASHWRHALWILAASTLVRLALGAVIPLYADEAYYWEWSRRLAFGYFDHPPVIAWLVATGTALLGDTPLGVRLLPILAGSSGGLAVALTVRQIAGATAGRFAAVIISVMPLAAGGLVLATPDAPLFGAGAFTLYAVTRAVDPAAVPRDVLRYWLLAGVAVGVAMASKLSGVLIPVGVFVAFVLEPSLRRHFTSSGPWLAVGVASVMMIPILVWNAQHDWISIRFQLQHGLGTSGRDAWLTREAMLVVVQAALVSPILFALYLRSIVAGWRAPRDPARFVLAAVASVAVALFVISATRRSVEPNWLASAWLPGMILLASARPAKRSRWELTGVALAAALSAVALTHVVVPFLPVRPRGDSTLKSHGWEALASVVDSTRTALAGRAPMVVTNRYQDAALLAFHLKGHPMVQSLNLGARRNQYELWSRFEQRAEPGATMLLVLDARSESDSSLPSSVRRLAPHFTEIARGPLVAIARGDAIFGERRLWVLSGWNGSWPTDSIAPLAHSTP